LVAAVRLLVLLMEPMVAIQVLIASHHLAAAVVAKMAHPVQAVALVEELEFKVQTCILQNLALQELQAKVIMVVLEIEVTLEKIMFCLVAVVEVQVLLVEMQEQLEIHPI
jgi:hypothetical protein